MTTEQKIVTRILSCEENNRMLHHYRNDIPNGVLEITITDWLGDGTKVVLEVGLLKLNAHNFGVFGYVDKSFDRYHVDDIYLFHQLEKEAYDYLVGCYMRWFQEIREYHKQNPEAPLDLEGIISKYF